MQTYPVQYDFTAGEISPLLAGRLDIKTYKKSAKTLLNCTPTVHGGVKRRPGTRYVAVVADSTKATISIPFEFSTTQAYIIELGHLYMRFYKDSGRIESPPGTPVSIVTPWLSTELADVKFAQKEDTLYLVHPNHAPRKLTRTSHTAWTLTVVVFLDGPYLTVNTTSTTMTPSATTGTITITLSDAGGINNATGFQTTDVGRFIRIKHGSTWGYARITVRTSAVLVTADVLTAFGAATSSSVYHMGAWSGTTGYPSCVGFHEQRLFFAGAAGSPQQVDGSKTVDFENFTPGTTDSDPLSYVLATNDVNVIKWLSPQSTALLIGTVKSEFSLVGGSDSPLTPSNVRAKRNTKHGSNNVAPVEAGADTLFVQRSGRKARKIEFSLERDRYTADDVTLRAEHITRSGIKSWCYQQEPDSVVWAARNDGDLLSLTYLPQEQVVGWAGHSTQGAFESLASIPHPAGDKDQTWTITKRNLNGSDVRCVEWLDPDLYVDCGLSYSGAATSTISGLNHLEGETVDILGNDAVYPQQVVTGGQVTGLNPTVTEAQVGLPFYPKIVTLQPEVETKNGTSQGKMKRWNQVFVRVFNSRGIIINGDVHESRSTDDPMDTAPADITDDIRVTQLGYDTHGEITIEQNQPLPFHVLAYFGALDVADDY